jgi:hypothetical protein
LPWLFYFISLAYRIVAPAFRIVAPAFRIVAPAFRPGGDIKKKAAPSRETAFYFIK